MLADIFPIMAPLLVCTGIGFFWARAKLPYDTNMVALLVTNIGAPSLILATLGKLEIGHAALGEMALIAVLSYAAFAAIGAVGLRLAGLSLRSFLPATMFPNVGNMGLATAYFAYGDAGLVLGMVFFMIAAVGQTTIGISIAAGTTSVRQILRLPIVYAALIAVILNLTDTTQPRWVSNTVEVLGGLTIPLMLITLGAALAQLRLAGLRRAGLISLLRLGPGLLIGIALGQAFGLDPVARGVVILQSAMPVAVMNYLFAQRYNTAPEEVAGAVLISTLISFVTLPLILTLVL